MVNNYSLSKGYLTIKNLWSRRCRAPLYILNLLPFLPKDVGYFLHIVSFVSHAGLVGSHCQGHTTDVHVHPNSEQKTKTGIDKIPMLFNCSRLCF